MLKALCMTGAVAGASQLVVPAAALASPADYEVVTQTVSFADLNLASEEGVRALKSRIRGAAGSICDKGYYSAMFGDHSRFACVKKAVASAQHQFEFAVASARPSGATVLGAATLTITTLRH